MSVACDSLSQWLHAAPGMVPTAVQVGGLVVEQEELAHETYRLRIACPELASRIRPGQFFMLRTPNPNDPLLGRPFALYDIYEEEGRPAGIDFGYHVVGKVTSLMPRWTAGQPVELWGPLGNGFAPPAVEHLICVGGGIGYTPFLAVLREAAGQQKYGDPRRDVTPPKRLSFCYGVRSQTYRADLTPFEQIPGLDIRIATDDGSEGHHGFVTSLLEKLFDEQGTSGSGVYCCGPEPMMYAVARLCVQNGVPCLLSLETPMACGFGACFSCVTKVRVDEEPGWDYRRTCIEGPVFDAATLAFDVVPN